MFPRAGYVRKRAPGRLQPAGSRSRRWERRGWALGRGPRPQPTGWRPRLQLSSWVLSRRTRLCWLVARSLQLHIAGAIINRQAGTPAHLHLLVSPDLRARLGFLTASFDGVGYSRPEETLELRVSSKTSVTREGDTYEHGRLAGQAVFLTFQQYKVIAQ